MSVTLPDISQNINPYFIFKLSLFCLTKVKIYQFYLNNEQPNDKQFNQTTAFVHLSPCTVTISP